MRQVQKYRGEGAEVLSVECVTVYCLLDISWANGGKEPVEISYPG